MILYFNHKSTIHLEGARRILDLTVFTKSDMGMKDESG